MNFPQTVDELIHWDVSTAHDSFGVYTIITGFEGTGCCFWCGTNLNGERRRFCGHRSGCWTRYQEHFAWSYASHAALRRVGRKCENCGKEERDIPEIGGHWNIRTGLEVHHIIPLNGEDRAVSVYNIFWNLICLCHDCHMELHAILRQLKELTAKPDTFEVALALGQSVMRLEI